MSTKDFFQKVPFLPRNGCSTVEVRPGYSKTKMEIKNNKNHFDVMYAGAIYCLAEASGGNLFFVTFDQAKYYPLIYKHEIRYVAPAKSDIFFEIQMSQEEAKKVQQEMDVKGKSNFKIEADITDSNGKVVAKSIGYYQGRSINAKL